MSVDLSQFHQVFFEESFEGLDIMESQLLELQPGDVDSETVNTIFRAAHSIKGGAGTFGFMQISEFTHVVETLLDEIRAGQREMEQRYVDLFLLSVDCQRSMLTSLQAGDEADMERANELKGEFEIILNGEALSEPETMIGSEVVSTENSGWHVRFKSDPDILRTGNEPFRMFRELSDIVGKDNIEIVPDLSTLPEFTSLNPEECHLCWDIYIKKDVEKSDISCVFEWVEDDCDIQYQPLSPSESASVEIANTTAEDEEAVSIEMVSEAVPSEIKPVSAEPEERLDKPANRSGNKVSKAAKSSAKAAENSSIRVSIDKVDSLINMVGELVITQSMLGQLGNEFDLSRLAKLREGLSQLEQNTRELQESVMKIRMMPISFAFSRFPRLVRDLGIN